MARHTLNYTGEQIDDRLSSIGQKIDDSPMDSTQYARKNSQWVEVSDRIQQTTRFIYVYADNTQDEIDFKVITEN